MRIPSVKTLSAVFEDPRAARQIMEMTRAELEKTEAGQALLCQCQNPPSRWHLRMHVLNALDPGLHGLEATQSTNGSYANYLNTGDTYAPTLIYWQGQYRVQSLGDFVETQERNGVRFH